MSATQRVDIQESQSLFALEELEARDIACQKSVKRVRYQADSQLTATRDDPTSPTHLL